MPSISDYYKYATLATASYVRMGGEPLTGPRFAEVARDQDRLPKSLADFLFAPDPTRPNPNSWAILSYYGSDAREIASDKSGFGATLFENSGTGEKVLALRGTEPFKDWGVDLVSADLGQIGILGLALTQVVSLANYVMRLKASTGDVHVAQLEVAVTLDKPSHDVPYIAAQGSMPGGEDGVPVNTPVYITITRKAQDARGLDMIHAGDIVTLTGHSLGGHLAVMAAMLFPDLFQQEVVVFNAAGYDPDTADTVQLYGLSAVLKAAVALELGRDANVLDTHGNQLALPALAKIELALGRSQILGTPTVVPVVSEDLLPGDDTSNVPTSLTGADKYGMPVELPTEENSHLIEPLMDALALQAAIEPTTGTSFGTPEVTQVLRASANKNERSYEALVEGLFRLFLKDETFLDADGNAGAERLPISDESSVFKIGKGPIGARQAFHDAVLRLQDAIKAKPLAKIFSLTNATADGLKNSAMSGDVDALAHRYALTALNPFVVVGDESIYAGHNKNGELNLYFDAVSTPAGMTSSYIEDRAKFLYWKNLANVADRGFYADASPASMNWVYVDRPQAFNVKIDGATQAPEAPARVAMFGGDKSDVLVGGLADDRLYGGVGTDFLAGGAGADYLEGGAGNDVYQYSAGKSLLGELSNGGVDEIRDTDGRGLVRYEFVEKGVFSDTVTSWAIAGVGIKVSDSEWKSADGKFTFNTQFDGALKVTINGDAGGTIRIMDFNFAKAQSDEFMGIRLVEAPGLPVPARVIEGDLEPLDVDPNTPGTQTDTDEFGNLLVTTNPAPNRADTLFGSDGQNGSDPNDNIIAGGGDDVIDARSGDDIVQGGSGRDAIDAGSGNDLVEAGANGTLAGDIVQGGAGDDRLYADARFDPAGTVATELAAALAAGEARGASGLRGDFLSAGPGNDIAIGAVGDDVLSGGGGSDILIGGAGNDYLLGDSKVRAANLDWGVTRVSTGQYSIPSPLGPILDFALFDLNVVDWTEDPEAGADALYGGSGNDWMDGGAGNDFLDGGSGNDVVFGNIGDDILLGGAGDDLLDGDHASIAAAFGGDDYLDGGPGNDWLFGRGGDDILFGGPGDDHIEGNEGNDILVGGPGSDVLRGGAGKDTYVLNRGDGFDAVFDTSDKASVAEASVVVFGGEIVRGMVKFRPGSLIIDVGEGDGLWMEGFDPDDPFSTPVLAVIQFADGDFMIFEDVLAQGFDIDGTSEDDEIYGTAVTDRIFADDGNDYVVAKAGDDMVDGGTGDDEIYAGEGNDVVTAGEGNDFVDGAGGDDTIDGGAGDDILRGGDGADTISGGEGNDVLYGEAGDDVLNGGDGDDVLDGGTGNDILTGGAGSDTYVIYGGMGADTIADGELGETNVLQLGASLTLDNLKASQVGDSLVISLRGLNDSVTITDYYARPQDWVVRDFSGTDTPLDAVIDQPDPYAGDFIGRLWADMKLGATATVLGQAYAIGWTPLYGSTFESFQERAYLDYVRQTTTETFTRFDPPNDQIAQNTFEDLSYTVEGFGTRSSSNFFWLLQSFESGRVESDDTFIQGASIVLPQLQSAGQALLTLKPDRQLLNYQVTEWSVPGTVVSYDTGAETILAFVAYENEVESYNQFAEVVGVSTDLGSWFHAKDSVVGNRVLVDMTRIESRYLSVNEIYGGPGDNFIIAGSSSLVFPLVTLIDGGAGNDTLLGDGGLLFGNVGDDELSGARAILIGGDGNDMLTGLGGTRFVYTATETGIDKLREADIATERYFDWYYAGFGIADWRESAEHGGEYRADFGDGDYDYYDTLAEAQQFGGGDIVFIDPLPGSPTVIRRTDAAALEALEAAGVLTRDVVTLGPGIGLGDLALTVRVIGLTADEHPDEPWYGGGTLNVRWGSGAGFDMAIPDSTYGAVGNDLFAVLVSPTGNVHQAWEEYELGVGVELFEFADGGTYTLDEVLQQATVIKRYGYEFLRGSGFQIVEGNWTGVDFGEGIAPSDIYAFQSGPDLVFGVIADSATGNIPNWYANPATVPPWEFRFADGTVLDTDSVTRLGQRRVGSPFDDRIEIFSNFASALIGLGGNDVLIGGPGNDLLNGGPGHDFLHGQAGNDIYVFGADSDVDYVNEQVFGGGSNGIDTVRFNADVSTADLAADRSFDFLTLRVVSSGAELQLPGWFAETGGTVEVFEFSDGTVWQAADVEALLEPQVATDGDDMLLGLTGNDILDGGAGDDAIYGFGGNDTLSGGPGSDFLYGGAGDDTYLFGPGDGVDEISDRSGSNTLSFGDGIDPGSVRVSRDYDSLYLSIAGSNDRVGILGWFFAAQPQLSRVTFADGTTWTAAELASRVGLVSASEFNDILWGTDGADVIDGLGGDDQIYGNDGDDVLEGGDGADYIESGAGNDILRGGAGDDDLEGYPGDGHKLLVGGEGDDYIYYEGRSLAIGGPGDDWIDVYGGNGIVAFNPGDGADTIGANEAFILSIGGGVGAADLSLSEEGSDIVISVGGADSVRLTNDLGGGQGSWPTIILQLFGSAHVYYLGGVINEFYNARAADPSLTEFGLGEVLPRYLLLSSETGALGGVIAHQYATRGTIAHVSNDQLLAVLRDPRFGPFFQDTAFESGNSEPTLEHPIADAAASEDATFAYTIPADTFADPDAGDTLTYAATLDDGSNLPAWLAFNAGTRTFSGTPLQIDVGTLNVKVTATDGGGLSAADTFALTVENVNDAPVVAVPLADWSFEAGSAFSFLIPATTFDDEDPGDTLSISASIFGGLPLPTWLSFDAASATFTGNPTAGNIGISHLQVTATDAAGASAASDFGLVVRAAAGSEVVGTPDDDILYGGTGDETITAKGGSDYLYGDIGDDLLKGGGGNDVLQGGDGADVLRGGKGQNVLDGGAGDDLIFGGKGSSLIVGGAGNDTIRTGSGSDVILFNRGDGMDTVIADRAGDNTLSFGGGIRYSDLSLSRDGKNLIVSAGDGDQITFKNWYAGKHSVLNLQIVLDATDEFDTTSSDPLYNKKVQTFDFLGMVSAFDATQAQTPGLTSWAITNALLQFHLFGADDMALGGDLAYWYGRKNSFSGLSLAAAQQTIGAAGFGADAQTLRPFDGLQEGYVKLA